MAKFGSTPFDPMEWDFTPWGGDTGVIPEPSNAQIVHFWQVYMDIIGHEDPPFKEAATDESPAVPWSREEREAMVTDVNEQTAALIDEVCSGVFTKDTPGDLLLALPHRVFQAFLSWFVEQLGPKA